MCCAGLATLISMTAASSMWWLHITGSSQPVLYCEFLFLRHLLLICYIIQILSVSSAGELGCSLCWWCAVGHGYVLRSDAPSTPSFYYTGVLLYCSSSSISDGHCTIVSSSSLLGYDLFLSTVALRTLDSHAFRIRILSMLPLYHLLRYSPLPLYHYTWLYATLCSFYLVSSFDLSFLEPHCTLVSTWIYLVFAVLDLTLCLTSYSIIGSSSHISRTSTSPDHPLAPRDLTISTTGAHREGYLV